MKRLGWVVAVAVLAWAPACGDEEAGPLELEAARSAAAPRFERRCGGGEACPGRKCIQVGPNEQGAAGVCSRACVSDLDCGPDGACFQLGGAGASCLSLCSEQAECEGGLVCVVIGSGGEKACFVEAIAVQPLR